MAGNYLINSLVVRLNIELLLYALFNVFDIFRKRQLLFPFVAFEDPSCYFLGIRQASLQDELRWTLF